MFRHHRLSLLAGCLALVAGTPVQAGEEHSVARLWSEQLLAAIRTDFARPTVHARNLFHTSVAMYDAWAVYDDTAAPFLLNQRRGGFPCPFDGVPDPLDVEAAREEAISYAAYRLLTHRFANSPGAEASLPRMDSLFVALGYDPALTSIDYRTGDPAALGNFIANRIIAFGLQDGSNEANNYRNRYYQPHNEPLLPELPGNPDITEPDHWQPLGFEIFEDQSGHVIPGAVPPFLSPEWGQVVPFALSEDDLTINRREGFDYWVYHDPGLPPGLVDGNPLRPEYQWGHALVAIWSSHLDPADGVMWDISPGGIGNIPLEAYPETVEGLRGFYDLEEGGDPGLGHAMNPSTGQPYEPQMVPRGDYARCLAEFWADGPDSETPPGHWFTILNYVNDHPLLVKDFEGDPGQPLGDLEWDVKAYLALGGAVHDAAVTAWGIKGWYDYVRPISAIRCMADRGQCTDPGQPSYDPEGIDLLPGFVELVEADDPLAIDDPSAVGKIKLFAWKGPEFIEEPESDVAGVDWILAENWWPYQRPTFITPPFAGYISGHSTFSRASAVILELLTGDPFFPGGMGEFHCPMNEFLVFEDGPSVDLTLQWATYRDASDQTSLSRIWGGIHPPVDDVPGRHIGQEIGTDAFEYAKALFRGEVEPATFITNVVLAPNTPNPIRATATRIRFGIPDDATQLRLAVYDIRGREITRLAGGATVAGEYTVEWDGTDASGRRLPSGTYFYRLNGLLRENGHYFEETRKMVLVR